VLTYKWNELGYISKEGPCIMREVTSASQENTHVHREVAKQSLRSSPISSAITQVNTARTLRVPNMRAQSLDASTVATMGSLAKTSSRAITRTCMKGGWPCLGSLTKRSCRRRRVLLDKRAHTEGQREGAQAALKGS